MTSPDPHGTAPEGGTGKSASLPLDGDEEVALSPESKKVLEACTVTMAPVQSKEPSTLIARPSTSGVDMASFQFAIPSRQVSKFAARPQKRPAGMTRPREKAPENSQTQDNPKETPENLGDSNDLPRHDCRRNDATGVEREKTVSRDNTVTRLTPMDETAGTQQELQARLHQNHKDQGAEHRMRKENAVRIQECHGTRGREQTISSEAHVNKAPGPQTQTYRTDTQKGETKSYSPIESSNRGPPAQSPNSPAVSVPKQRISVAKAANQTPSTSDRNPTSAPVHSEADLFYMLIHKLKRRDEAEAADASLKEQMRGELHRAEEENRTLTVKIRQAVARSSQQESEIAHQRDLVNRWKLKLDKLRSILKGVIDDQNSLRSDGQNMKDMQSSLRDEKEQIVEELKTISSLTATVKERLDQQRHQLSGVRNDVISLESAVTCAETKATEKEKAFSRERNRVATLEGYIKRSSNTHHKKLSSIQIKQAEAMSKVDELSKYVEHDISDTRPGLKAELDTLTHSVAKISASINEGQSSDSTQLEQLRASIQSLNGHLNEHHRTTIKDLELSCDEQRNRESQMVARLANIETVLCAAAKAADREAEARDTNRKLQEKLNSVEISLEESNINRDRLKASEVDLTGQIHDLQAEVAKLRSESEAQSDGQIDTNSELQLQLEAASSALTDASENAAAKENEIQSLKSELENVKASLENSELVVTALESEKLLIERNARSAEQRVREELTRASLKSKDQSRALFEQEQHKLKREKEAAEKNVQSFKEQLDATKNSLAEANRNLDRLETRTSDQLTEIEKLKDGNSRSGDEMSNEVSSLKELITRYTRDKDTIDGQLEEARKENEELKKEVTNLQATAGDANQMDILQERVDMLQRECTEKKHNLVALKEEAEKARAEAKEMAKFQDIALERSTEMNQLKENLQEVQRKSMEEASRVEKKEQDIAILTEKLEASEKQDNELLQPNNSIHGFQGEVRTFEGRHQDTSPWLSKIEDLLRKLDFIGPQDSLSSSWDALETRLRQTVSQAERDRTHHSEKTGTPARETPHQHERGFRHSRTVFSTPRMKRTNSRTSAQEYQTTELVYSQHKIRKSISISPRKPKPLQRAKFFKSQLDSTTEPGTRITPFSQVQSNSNIQRQGSPLSQLTDLSSMFPESPENDNEQPETGHVHFTDNCMHQEVQSGRSTVQQSTSSLQNEARPEMPKRRDLVTKGFSDDSAPLKEKSANAPTVVPSAKRKGPEGDVFEDEGKMNGRKKARFPDLESHNPGPRSQPASQDAAQNQPGREPSKSILKDAPTIPPPTVESTLTQTPTNKPKTRQGRVQRRPSRTSSAYFTGPGGQAATRSSGAVSTKRGNQAIEASGTTGAGAMPQTRRKGRRGNKGDQYNFRFSQTVPRI